MRLVQACAAIAAFMAPSIALAAQWQYEPDAGTGYAYYSDRGFMDGRNTIFLYCYREMGTVRNGCRMKVKLNNRGLMPNGEPNNNLKFTFSDGQSYDIFDNDEIGCDGKYTNHSKTLLCHNDPIITKAMMTNKWVLAKHSSGASYKFPLQGFAKSYKLAIRDH